MCIIILSELFRMADVEESIHVHGRLNRRISTPLSPVPRVLCGETTAAIVGWPSLCPV